MLIVSPDKRTYSESQRMKIFGQKNKMERKHIVFNELPQENLYIQNIWERSYRELTMDK